MEISICVTLSVIGCHWYPNAKLESLRQKHHHNFTIAVTMEETKSREIEWIEFRDWLAAKLADKYQDKDGIFQFGPLSCELIADKVADIVAERYVGDCLVSVAESDEGCGAEVYFTEEEMKKKHESRSQRVERCKDSVVA